MFNELTGLAWGLVVFAIIIGAGSLVLTEFGDGAGANTQTDNDTEYLSTQLGETGLAGWTPAIIAVFMAVLFIGALSFGRRRK